MTIIVCIDATVAMRWAGVWSACHWGLVTVLGIGLWRRPSEALVSGLCGGLLTDCLTASAFGSSTVGFALVAWGTTKLRRHLYKEHPLVQMALAGAAVMVGWWIGWYFARAGEGVPGSFGRWVWPAVLSSVLTALVAPLWLRVVRPMVVRGW